MPDPDPSQGSSSRSSCVAPRGSSSTSSRSIPSKYLLHGPQRINLLIPVSVSVVDGSNSSGSVSGVNDSAQILSETELEYSIHSVPSLMRRELAAVVCTDDVNIKTSALPLLCIATWQKSCRGLIHATPDAQRERNRLLETFNGWGKHLAHWIRDHKREDESGRHHWADLIDPCTGSVTLGRPSGGIYSEVEGMAMLLRYRVQQAGFCHVVLHPRWHDHAYPASIFTDAPLELVHQAIQYTNHRFRIPIHNLLSSPASASASSSALHNLTKEEEQQLKMRDDLTLHKQKLPSVNSDSSTNTSAPSTSPSSSPSLEWQSSSLSSSCSDVSPAAKESDSTNAAAASQSGTDSSSAQSHFHAGSSLSTSGCDSCAVLAKLRDLTPIHLRSYTKPGLGSAATSTAATLPTPIL